MIIWVNDQPTLWIDSVDSDGQFTVNNGAWNGTIFEDEFLVNDTGRRVAYQKITEDPKCNSKYYGMSDYNTILSLAKDQESSLEKYSFNELIEKALLYTPIFSDGPDNIPY